VPWRARDFVHFQLRGRGGRSQLKREPLGRCHALSLKLPTRLVTVVHRRGIFQGGSGIGG